MNKLLFSLFALALFFLLNTGVVSANSSSCQIIYGGGQVCPQNVSFTVKKEVRKPNSTTVFVSDLSINDPKFTPNSKVFFKITIKNTGTAEIRNMTITDTLPQFVTFVSGGKVSGKTVTITLDKLTPGASRSFDVEAKVVDASLLPQDKGTVCVINKAKGEVSGESAEDSTQFCIERKVLGANPTPQVVTTTPPKTVPTTGPEMLPLLALVASGVTGILLRKKTSR